MGKVHYIVKNDVKYTLKVVKEEAGSFSLLWPNVESKTTHHAMAEIRAKKVNYTRS